jgi:hypothetical protein
MRLAEVEVIFVNSSGSPVEIRASSYNLAKGSALIKRFPERKSFLVERVTMRSGLNFKRSYVKKEVITERTKRKKMRRRLCYVIVRVCFFAQRNRKNEVTRPWMFSRNFSIIL